MQLITIQENQPKVSHRVIASNTENEAKNILELISRYKADFEAFGIVTFKTEKLNSGAGRGKITHYLNEQQATRY